MNARFDLVIFDFDGTVADSAPGITRSAAYALEKMGRPVPDQSVLNRFVGPPLKYSFCEFCGLSDEEGQRAVDLYRERYPVQGLFEADVYPGFTPMLRRLRASGVKLAIASGKPEVFLKRIVTHFGLDALLCGVAGIEMTNHSPDKSEQLRRVIPEGLPYDRVCMVGDRCFDINAAKKLGVTAVGVTYGYGSREELTESGADVICESVAELSDYLTGGAPAERGRFITFEGTDGCGKSTQIKKLDEYLRHRGYETIVTREPGGGPISERIREVILSVENTGMCAECEALLYAASRIQHVRDTILPALNCGKIVLCDRFFDSSLAYQAYGRQLGEAFVRQINQKATDEVAPDCTIQLDIDPDTARARVNAARTPDRLEREKEDFFDRVRDGYEAVAAEAPQRIHRIHSGRSVQEVFEDILRAVQL